MKRLTAAVVQASQAALARSGAVSTIPQHAVRPWTLEAVPEDWTRIETRQLVRRRGFEHRLPADLDVGAILRANVQPAARVL